MKDNFLYTTVDDVIGDIARIIKQKTINREDVMAWSFELLTDIIPDVDSMVKYRDIPLDVVAGLKPTALLPCNVHMLEDVYSSLNSTEGINYITNGTYLYLDESYTLDTVYVSYVGLRILDNGDPAILKTHKQACVWFSIHNMYMEDYLNNKLNGQQWGEIVRNKDMQISAAKHSFRNWTTDDFRKMDIILGNLVPKIGTSTLKHKRFG